MKITPIRFYGKVMTSPFGILHIFEVQQLRDLYIPVDDRLAAP